MGRTTLPIWRPRISNEAPLLPSFRSYSRSFSSPATITRSPFWISFATASAWFSQNDTRRQVVDSVSHCPVCSFFRLWFSATDTSHTALPLAVNFNWTSPTLPTTVVKAITVLLLAVVVVLLVWTRLVSRFSVAHLARSHCFAPRCTVGVVYLAHRLSVRSVHQLTVVGLVVVVRQ